MNDKKSMDETVWGWFCAAHPHEAAEMDWPRFVVYAAKRAPGITEEELRANLRETEE